MNREDIIISKNGVPIRLTAERWWHIIENHDDLAGYYDDVLASGWGAKLCYKRLTKGRLLH